MKIIWMWIVAVSICLVVAICWPSRTVASSDKAPENHIVSITTMWEPDTTIRQNWGKWVRFTFDDGVSCYRFFDTSYAQTSCVR